MSSQSRKLMNNSVWIQHTWPRLIIFSYCDRWECSVIASGKGWMVQWVSSPHSACHKLFCNHKVFMNFGRSNFQATIARHYFSRTLFPLHHQEKTKISIPKIALYPLNSFIVHSENSKNIHRYKLVENEGWS